MKPPFKEGNPLENWQIRFPLPESFNNPEFKMWVVGLDGESQKNVGRDISNWYIEYLKTVSTPIDEQTKRQIDQFLGATMNMKNNSLVLPGVSNQHRGTMMRIFTEGMVKRKLI